LVAARPIAALAAPLATAGPIAALTAALAALLSAQLAKLFVAVEFRAVGISVDWIFHGIFLRRNDFD
jgi:hypothetical protein